MEQLHSRLADAGRISAAEYFSMITRSTSSIFDRVSDENLLRSSIDSNDLQEVRSLLSASLLLNDLSIVTCLGGGPTTFRYLQSQDEILESFGGREVRFKSRVSDLERMDIDSGKPYLLPAFMYPTGFEMDHLVKEVASFIEDGRVILQPIKIAIGRQRSSTEKQNHWAVLGADQRSPANLWDLSPSTPYSNPVPIHIDESGSNGGEVFKVVLPIASKVPFSELHKLLKQESGLVSSFRSSLKIAIKKANAEDVSTAEFVKDVIDPQLDQIQRRYKSIERTHRAKTAAAAITSVSLAYASIDEGGVAASLLSIAAAGGFYSLLNGYADYSSDRDRLKEEPFYLLWRCKRLAE